MDERLRAALDAAKVTYSIELYAGAAHGWTMQDFPIYDRAAAERHWVAMTRFFGETLG